MLNNDLWIEIMTCLEDPRDIVRLRMVRFKITECMAPPPNGGAVLYVGLSVSLYNHAQTFRLAARS